MSTVVVIGGGVIGTATALHLGEADPGLDVVLVEADLGRGGRRAGGRSRLAGERLPLRRRPR